MVSLLWKWSITQQLIVNRDLKWKPSLYNCLVAEDVSLVKTYVHFYNE